ncbi:MAG TPA: c-type cytochrome biogenesis protein CcmI [Thioalkalivibrio sp.]|nr:c-type cytochrome biogenesis protein CcmI [Thioalkalivibrio sp.]
MSQFWLLAALLVIAALLFLLVPMRRGVAARPAAETDAVALYRRQAAELEADRDVGAISAAQYEAARLDLKRALLEAAASPATDTRGPARSWRLPVGIAVVLLVPVLAVVAYDRLGSGAAGIAIHRAAVETHEGSADMAATVTALQARLDANPEDVAGWRLLARSYLTLGRVGAALQAYARAMEHGGAKDADLLVDHAELRARLKDGDFAGEPEALLMAALQLAPEHPRGLWFAGLAGQRAGDYRRARAYWGRLIVLLPEGSEDHRLVSRRLAELEALIEAGG